MVKYLLDPDRKGNVEDVSLVGLRAPDPASLPLRNVIWISEFDTKLAFACLGPPVQMPPPRPPPGAIVRGLHFQLCKREDFCSFAHCLDDHHPDADINGDLITIQAAGIVMRGFPPLFGFSRQNCCKWRVVRVLSCRTGKYGKIVRMGSSVKMWGRRRRRRRRYSPSGRCAGCVAWSSSCRSRCAAQGASGRRSGRWRGRSSRSRKGGKWGQRETLMHEDEMKWDSTSWAKTRCVWHDIKKDGDCALYVPIVLVDVVCVMLVVLIALTDVVHSVDTVFVAIFCSWRCTLYRRRKREWSRSDHPRSAKMSKTWEMWHMCKEPVWHLEPWAMRVCAHAWRCANVRRQTVQQKNVHATRECVHLPSYALLLLQHVYKPFRTSENLSRRKMNIHHSMTILTKFFSIRLLGAVSVRTAHLQKVSDFIVPCPCWSFSLVLVPSVGIQSKRDARKVLTIWCTKKSIYSD